MVICHCLGYPVNIAEVNDICETATDPQTLTDLPEYPFNHTQKHWMESRVRSYRFRKFSRYELLGTPVSDWNPLEARWRNVFKVSEYPWIKDYRVREIPACFSVETNKYKVNGSILYPAAGMLIMAIEAARQLADQNRNITGYRIQEATFRKALIIPSSPNGVETQICLRPVKDTNSKGSLWSEFHIYVHEDDKWTECCDGVVVVEYEEERSELGPCDEQQSEF